MIYLSKLLFNYLFIIVYYIFSRENFDLQMRVIYLSLILKFSHLLHIHNDSKKKKKLKFNLTITFETKKLCLTFFMEEKMDVVLFFLKKWTQQCYMFTIVLKCSHLVQIYNKTKYKILIFFIYFCCRERLTFFGLGFFFI